MCRPRLARLEAVSLGKEAIRYGAFLGVFAGGFTVVDEGIAALFSARRYHTRFVD